MPAHGTARKRSPRVANSTPPDRTATNRHVARRPSRSTHARTATPIASSASANPPPVGAIGESSASNANAHRVKCERIASALPANRRNHALTVPTGTASSRAIRTYPTRLRLDRPADHLHLVPAPQKAQIRQQNVRSPTAAADPPTRPQHHRLPPPQPNRPPPRPPPRRQHTPAQRARQRPTPKIGLDLGHHHTYHHHLGATSGIRRAHPTQPPSWREGSHASTNARSVTNYTPTAAPAMPTLDVTPSPSHAEPP